ncbi:MAG TPA: YkgJ family cysteine cluster protein [Povalibacter sp.]
MEIAIDFVTVRRIIAEETRQARAEIAAHGPIAACEQSQHRHDARLAAAADANTLACNAGCSWCCHFTVDVRAAEVFRILDFMQRTLSATELVRVRSEVEVNRGTMLQLSEIERMQHNTKCPFLAAGRCTIYAARPQTCRNYHATDAAGCRQSFEEPDNLDIDPEFAPLVYQAGASHVDGFTKALQAEGYDTAVYEMNIALAAAMEQPEAARARFLAKLAPFTELQGEDVPCEFADDE